MKSRDEIIQDHRRRVGEWNRKNSLKRRAHKLVARALKLGELVRPDCCSRCNDPQTPIAHHPDYSKPLKVQWLCDSCHGQVHRDLKLAAAT